MRLRFNQINFYLRLEQNFIRLFFVREFQTEMSAHANRMLHSCSVCAALRCLLLTLLSFMFLTSKAFPCLHTCCSKTYALVKTQLNRSVFLEVFSDIAIRINLSLSAIPIVSIMFNFCSYL